METLNRYIDGGRNPIRRRICVVSRIRDAEYGLVAHGNLAAAAPIVCPCQADSSQLKPATFASFHGLQRSSQTRDRAFSGCWRSPLWAGAAKLAFHKSSLASVGGYCRARGTLGLCCLSDRSRSSRGWRFAL